MTNSFLPRPFRKPPRSFSPLLLIPLLLILLAACTPTATTTLPPTDIPPTRPTKTPLILPATWTPGPATETPLPPTPRPTWTNTPEPTTPPTLPPSPTSFPPVRIADASNHPSATYGLLFMQNGVVREWKVDGTVTDLVTLPGTTDRLDRVEMYDSSLGGVLVAILRRNAVGEFEIVIYDRAAKAIRWTQPVPITTPTALKLSPDNFWVAFASSGTSTQPGIIGTVLIEAPEQTFTLAECQPSCASIRWRFANSHLIWSDEAGIWDVDPLLGPNQTPIPILEPPLQILNSGGNNVTGVFTILSFSPSGRYLLLSKGSFPEAIPTIYDIESQRMADIPGSFLYTDPGTSVAWMFEDKLAVARAGLAADGRPGIEVWQLAPETDAFFLRERISYVGTSPSQAPFVIARLADGRVRFAMLDFSQAQYTKGNGIYQVDPRIDELLQLNNMPFIRATQAVWVPDGSGVLLLTANKVYYISGNGGGIYEMDSFLGASAERFAWVAP